MSAFPPQEKADQKAGQFSFLCVRAACGCLLWCVSAFWGGLSLSVEERARQAAGPKLKGMTVTFGQNQEQSVFCLPCCPPLSVLADSLDLSLSIFLLRLKTATMLWKDLISAFLLTWLFISYLENRPHLFPSFLPVLFFFLLSASAGRMALQPSREERLPSTQTNICPELNWANMDKRTQSLPLPWLSASLSFLFIIGKRTHGRERREALRVTKGDNKCNIQFLDIMRAKKFKYISLKQTAFLHITLVLETTYFDVAICKMIAELVS